MSKEINSFTPKKEDLPLYYAGLIPAEVRFVREYLRCFQPEESAIRARIRPDEAWCKRAAAHFMRRPLIIKAIEQALAGEGITKLTILEEYAKLGFTNFRDYFSMDDHGNVNAKNIDGLTPQQSAAIKKVKTRTYKTQDGADVTELDYELHDKKAALDSLSKALGIGGNAPGAAVQVNVNQTVNAPQVQASMTAKEAAEAYAATLEVQAIEVEPAK